MSRTDRIVQELKSVFEEVSGVALEGADPQLSFMEMGLDSLALTQAAGRLKKKVGVKVTFRQLIEELPSLATLAEYVDQKAPPEAFPAAPAPAPSAAPAPAAPVPQMQAQAMPQMQAQAMPQMQAQAMPQMAAMQAPMMGAMGMPMQQPHAYWQQMQAWQTYWQQMQAWQAYWQQMQAHPMYAQPAMGMPMQPMQAPPAAPSAPAPAPPTPAAAAPAPEPPTADEPKKFIGPAVRISTEKAKAHDATTQKAIDDFYAAYVARTKSSKAFTQDHRHHLADPRAVSGFKPALKEVTYPIVVDKSDGSKLWDIDGNEYVDVTCGFGSNFLGHRPQFINDAVKAQLDTGYEIGPQSPLAGEVAGLICEMSGHERVAFCNTGSEAVLGAMRIARTVTGNDTVAIMTGAYHGICNEVIVRGTKSLSSMPAAPGIPASHVENIIVVDYDDPKSLEILRERADDLAAIMIEPVQSRRPDLQPKDFLHACRKICNDADIPLILDEVITGFRIAPGGAQEHFEVSADICTYGKIIGGGLPIGAIAGRRKYLDALDGGHWQYGDASFPEVGVTYFAGTFVRWPLALAASKAALLKLKEYGKAGHDRLNAMTDEMCRTVNASFKEVGAPIKLKNFGSLWKPAIDEREPHASLVFHWMRHKGVHIWEARPCFLTFAHTERDVAFIVRAWEETVTEMQAEGLLSGNGKKLAPRPPVEGARLGRDAHGKPAWFVENPERKGEYLQVQV